VQRPTYDDLLNKQIEDAIAKKGRGKLDELLASDDTWVVQ
jgi:2-oxoglutarate ferredoxin oxidoreductase subunit beta